MGKHSQWRKLVKKLRRKRIRTAIALARDQQLFEEQRIRESSPTYKAWLKEQAVIEEFKAVEEERLAMQRHQVWEAENEAALLRWREQQSRLAHAKAEKFKREMFIKEEWEREQRKLQEAEKNRKKAEDEKKKKEAELLARIDAFIEGKGEFPEDINWPSETQPGQPECPFFSKTGACRFRDSCSRNHVRPGVSRTLLIPNFYDHIGLQSLNQEEYDTDIGLEYEDSETYQHFKEFYKDVLPEFEQCGTVVQFRVCNNEEPHLRGNVYVEYLSRRHSLKASRTFQGRFYAGRRLNVDFVSIPSWKNAVCGLFHKQKCPKGKTCNFLHVFRNPNNAFRIQDGHSSSRRQLSRSRSRSPRRRRTRSRSKEWSWSEGSGSDNESKKKHRDNISSGTSKKSNLGSENNKKSSRSRSPAKKSDRSRSAAKKRGRSRSRSPVKRKDKSRSRSPAKRKTRTKRKDRSRSPAKRKDKNRSPTKRKDRSRSRSPAKRKDRSRSRGTTRRKERSKSKTRKNDRSRSRSLGKRKDRSKSKSPAKKKNRSRSQSPVKRKDRSRSRSPTKRKGRSPAKRKIRSRSRSPPKKKDNNIFKSPDRGNQQRLCSKDGKSTQLKNRSHNENKRSKSKSPQNDKREEASVKSNVTLQLNSNKKYNVVETVVSEEEINNATSTKYNTKNTKKDLSDNKKLKNERKTIDGSNINYEEKNLFFKKDEDSKHISNNNKLSSENSNDKPKDKSKKNIDKGCSKNIL